MRELEEGKGEPSVGLPSGLRLIYQSVLSFLLELSFDDYCLLEKAKRKLTLCFSNVYSYRVCHFSVLCLPPPPLFFSLLFLVLRVTVRTFSGTFLPKQPRHASSSGLFYFSMDECKITTLMHTGRDDWCV